jgi:hypothetical protein
LNRLRRRKRRPRRKTQQPLRLRASSPLRKPLLIRLRPRVLQPRRYPRHQHHRRLHLSRPLRLHGRRHIYSRPTQIG